MEVNSFANPKISRRRVVVDVFFRLSTAKTKNNTAAHPSSSHTSKPGHSSSKHPFPRARRGAWKRHGQQGIQSDASLAIQQALISGKSTGWRTHRKGMIARNMPWLSINPITNGSPGHPGLPRAD